MPIRPTPNNTKPFVATSFSTATIRWLHQEGWDGYHIDYFAVSRQAIPLLISGSPVDKRRDTDKNTRCSGRWILESTRHLGRPIAWAEAHLHSRSFSHTTLHLHAEDDWSSRSDIGEISRAIGMLVSGCFFLSQCDLLTIVANQNLATLVSNLPTFEAKTRMTLAADAWALPSTNQACVPIEVFTTSKHAWQTSTVGQVSDKELSYLEKRLKKRDLKTKPLRRGPLGILFPKRPCC